MYQACYGHAARARQALCAVTPSFQLRVVLQNACCKVLPLLAPPVVLASGSSCLPKAGSSALCRAHAVGRSSDPACVTLKNCLVSWYASLWSLSLYITEQDRGLLRSTVFALHWPGSAEYPSNRKTAYTNINITQTQ